MMEFGFRVRACKPKLVSRTKEASERAQTDKLLVILDKEATNFLRIMKERVPCSFCNKYYLFEARHKSFLPPTIIIRHSKDI